MPSPRCTLLNLLVSLLLATWCIFKSDVYPQNIGEAIILGHPSISLSVCQLLFWWEEGGCGCWPRAQTLAESHCFPSVQWHLCERHLASDVVGGEELLLVRAPFEFLLWMLQTKYVINTSDFNGLLKVYCTMTLSLYWNLGLKSNKIIMRCITCAKATHWTCCKKRKRKKNHT